MPGGQYTIAYQFAIAHGASDSLAVTYARCYIDEYARAYADRISHPDWNADKAHEHADAIAHGFALGRSAREHDAALPDPDDRWWTSSPDARRDG